MIIMEEILKKIEQEFEQNFADAQAQAGKLEELKIKFLGRKGQLNTVFKSLSGLSQQDRPVFGKRINELKEKIEKKLNERLAALNKRGPKTSADSRPENFDITLPAIKKDTGSVHPLTQVIDQICGLFVEMGFMIVEGPEIETEYHNFEALNIPLEHPSREAFDTFYLENKYLLRSHTSPVQIRFMEEHKPPVQIVVPGKVYRPDATDASHSFMFHQIEGLLIDKGITFAHLRGVLSVFAKKLFGEKTKMRFRPSFFPFTEPSAEVDISCIICAGRGCSVCGQSGWLEILGSGLVHPKVLEACNVNSRKYSGFAFGLGVERVAMLKYGIDDIRLFFENDLRFIKQF